MVDGFANDNERSLFDSFRYWALALQDETTDTLFWGRTVLQLSHTEPAVKHIALALSPYIRNNLTAIGDGHLENWLTDESEKQYSKALRHAQSLLTRTPALDTAKRKDIYSVLVACILFICFDHQCGRYESANRHLRSGMAIIRQMDSAASTKKPHQPSPGTSLAKERSPAIGVAHTANGEDSDDHRDDTVERSIVNLMGRLNVQAITFSDAAAPYGHSTNPDIDEEALQVPKTFTSIAKARASVVALMQFNLTLANAMGVAQYFWPDESTYSGAVGRAPKYVHDILAQKKERLSTALDRWEAAAGRLIDSKSVRYGKPIYILEAYHLLNAAILGAFSTGNEMEFDNHRAKFERIIDLCARILDLPDLRPTTGKQSPPPSESPPHAPTHADSTTPATAYDPSRPPSSPLPPSFSFDLGVVMPLFAVATRCRDPFLRDRALHLLHRANRWEGKWPSDAAARVAAFVVHVEEEAAEALIGRKPRDAADIPVSVRMKAIQTRANLSERRVNIKCLIPRMDVPRPEGHTQVPSETVEDRFLVVSRDINL